MKNSLLIYKAKRRHKNIGDYIQSAAAMQFTGSDVVYIEREHLHVYAGEQVKLIMNGWFMHFPENWPPSKNILPLFISFHINPEKADFMLDQKGVDYLKKNAPIGCRDKGTEKLLLSKGIPSYFSGCLTLTLGMTYKNNPKSENIYFVDPHFEVSRTALSIFRYFFAIIFNLKTISQISEKIYKSKSIKTLFRTAAFFTAYSKYFDNKILREANYLKHMILESELGDEENKFKYTRNLLLKYSKARLVVTSRIHAALPCLGMDTPVIFITNNYLNSPENPISQGRFDGLLELLNVIEYSNFQLSPVHGFNINEKIKFGDFIVNKKNHIDIVEKLKSTCFSFISKKL